MIPTETVVVRVTRRLNCNESMRPIHPGLMMLSLELYGRVEDHLTQCTLNTTVDGGLVRKNKMVCNSD